MIVFMYIRITMASELNNFPKIGNAKPYVYTSIYIYLYTAWIYKQENINDNDMIHTWQ